MKNIKKEKIAFYILFIIVGLLTMQVPFSQLVGAENLKFSLFDFFGPIAGAFIGLWGLAVVAIMQLVNWGINGFATELTSLIRLLPVLFAVLYFTKTYRKWTLIAPALAMIAFWAHPEGRGAWYFALYWTIPFIAYLFSDRFIFARALGATFTQHSVGGALWLWSTGMKSTIWLSLIPIVWRERFLMAIGITLTYILANYVLSIVREKTNWKLSFAEINKKFAIHHK